MRLLTMHDLVDMTRLSEKVIRRMVQQHIFPAPIPVPPDSQSPDYRWRLKDYEDWVKRQDSTDLAGAA